MLLMKRHAVVLATVILLAGCAAQQPLDEGSRKAGVQICDAMFNLRNGRVSSLKEAAGEIAWADTNAALVSASDNRFAHLAEHVAAVKAQLIAPNGRDVRQPGQFDPELTKAGIEGAAQECVRLEDAGLIP
jgi:hypothetical protein